MFVLPLLSLSSSMEGGVEALGTMAMDDVAWLYVSFARAHTHIRRCTNMRRHADPIERERGIKRDFLSREGRP